MNGILFESGCAKYLKLIPGNAQFHSSWENATQITEDEWKENKGFLLSHHNVDWYASTIRFLPIVNGRPRFKEVNDENQG